MNTGTASKGRVVSMAKKYNHGSRSTVTRSNSLHFLMRRSFISGVGSIIAVSGAPCFPRQTSPHRDCIALKNDWQNVGRYLSAAIDKFESLPR